MAVSVYICSFLQLESKESQGLKVWEDWDPHRRSTDPKDEDIFCYCYWWWNWWRWWGLIVNFIRERGREPAWWVEFEVKESWMEAGLHQSTWCIDDALISKSIKTQEGIIDRTDFSCIRSSYTSQLLLLAYKTLSSSDPHFCKDFNSELQQLHKQL